MKKIIRLTESDLMRLVNRVIKEETTTGTPTEGGGFGPLISKGELGEEMSLPNAGTFVDFLKAQGFKDWSGGNPGSYGMEYHYISRKPSTPANLSCSVGKEKGKNIKISIVFDSVIERAERYKTLEEYDQKSVIPKIEKLVGKDFYMSDKKEFSLSVDNLSEDTAKKIITLYNQIRLKGPYSK
jgi:hypothetical protein